MKYYAQSYKNNTLRKIIADSDEEAFAKATELFGTDQVMVGKTLQKMRSKEEQKEMDRIAEKVAGQLFGPAGKAAMRLMNETKYL